LFLLSPYTAAVFGWAGYRDGCDLARQAIAEDRDYELHERRPMWCIVLDPFAPDYAHWSGKQAGIRATLPTDQEYYNRALAELHAAGARIYGADEEYIAVSLAGVPANRSTLQQLAPLRYVRVLELRDVGNVSNDDLAEILSRLRYLESVTLVGKSWTEEDEVQLKARYSISRVRDESQALRRYGRLYSPSKSSP
jgi:hypothetical protein